MYWAATVKSFKPGKRLFHCCLCWGQFCTSVLGFRNQMRRQNGGVRAKDITSKKGSITVRAEDGGGVEAEKLKAKKDIDISSSGPGSDPKA